VPTADNDLFPFDDDWRDICRRTHLTHLLFTTYRDNRRVVKGVLTGKTVGKLPGGMADNAACPIWVYSAAKDFWSLAMPAISAVTCCIRVRNVSKFRFGWMVFSSI